MSVNAYWRPVVPRKGYGLDCRMKGLVARKYLDHDGSLGGSFTLDHADINYFRGLMDAGVKGADEIIEAIAKHTEIQIYIE